MKLIIFILALSVGLTNGDDELSRTIRPTTDEDTQQRAALGVISRLMGNDVVANNVVIKINFNLPGNYFKVKFSFLNLAVNKFSCLMKLAFMFYLILVSEKK